ncbi:kinase-like domain-containing protein [Hypoxylon cercidicola]|nr:kinase-like domain-containing protein [Hypoxylon cercidicola]
MDPDLPSISVTPAEALPIRPRTDFDDPQTDLDDPRTDLDNSQIDLDDLLRANLITHLDGREKDFLTIHCLRRLLPAEKVEEHLTRFFEDAKRDYQPRERDINYYLDLICPHPGRPTIVGEKSYIRLFATLVLTDKALDIFKFIDEGISDDTLPIPCHGNEASPIIRWGRLRYRDGFNMWQRRVNVPFLAHGEHRVFDIQDVLPFIKEPSHPSPQAHITEAGGYGEVSHVEIHQSCHNFPNVFGSLPRPTGPFARKKLLRNRSHRTDDDFRREAGMLKKFDGGVHPHIVTVLTTYKHGDDYYLIFPWAECDLARYCEMNPNPTRNLDTVQWLANQCLKIMEAVHLIHYPPGVATLRPDDQLYGRHGDIKAENILIFRSKEGEAQFVLSDFGLCSMHHDRSKSDVPNKGIPATPCFRPPECDMDGAVITRSFDIWNLGCLFLDLLTWLLGGEDLRQQFESERMTPYLNNLKTPIYFEVGTTINDKPGYIVKDQVKQWFVKMHNHQSCTRFVHEFLYLIEESMLIVETETKKRARTDKLLRDLEAFNKKCKAADAKAYCLDTVPAKSSLEEVKTPIIAEGSLNEQATNCIRNSGIELRRFLGSTEQVQQAREEGDEHMGDLHLVGLARRTFSKTT